LTIDRGYPILEAVRYLLALVLMVAACGDGSEDNPYCLPQRQVVIGALGTVGAPLANYATCYASGNPVLSLDGARAATVTEDTMVFAVSDITGTIDPATCGLHIEYTYDTMLSDNTPATGTNVFDAEPDPDDSTRWNLNGDGSVIFEWDTDSVCGNTLTDIVISVE
jgi:hypothetical protein